MRFHAPLVCEKVPSKPHILTGREAGRGALCSINLIRRAGIAHIRLIRHEQQGTDALKVAQFFRVLEPFSRVFIRCGRLVGNSDGFYIFEGVGFQQLNVLCFGTGVHGHF